MVQYDRMLDFKIKVDHCDLYFIIGSSTNLHIIRAGIESGTSLNVDQIRIFMLELPLSAKKQYLSLCQAVCLVLIRSL